MNRRLASFFLLLSAIIATMCFAACENKRPPSILLIAVDHFGPQAIDCTELSRTDKADKHDAQYRGGFQQLCINFIRYSRAYSTSTQTVPALSSILTGAYPLESGIHDNYGDFLSPQFETLSKLAVKKKWSTFFSSGGSPVLRRTGLGIGFQVFDDAIKPTLDMIYRPASGSFDSYLRFLAEAPSSSNFSVLYVPDLLYTKTKTQNSLGEERGLSYESQLENFDDMLGRFFQKLKSDDRWSATTIIVVGLNNSKTGAPGQPYSEAARISLYVKPMDNYPFSDSLKANRDALVSLPDLSASLYAALGSFISTSDLSLFKTFPLERVTNPVAAERWIAIEGPSVNGFDHFRWSILNGHANCVGGDKIQCFASSHDMNENLPLTGTELKNAQSAAEPVLTEMKKRLDAHEFHPAASSIAGGVAYEHCMELIKNHNSLADLKKECADSEVLDFVSWVQVDSDPAADFTKKENARRRFQKVYNFHQLDKVIENTNIDLGFIWPQRSSGRFLLLEALMDSPQYIKYRNILSHNSASQ